MRGTRRIGIGCAAALAVAWAGLGQGGLMPNAPTAHDLLAVQPVQAAPASGAVYGQRCAACHGGAGMGIAGTFPPLVETPVVNGDPHFLARVVLYGLAGRTTVKGQTYNISMAGLAGQMSDAQIAEVLTYIRSSWGNHSSAVTEDLVKAERAIPGTPQDNYSKYPK
jgi:mono/diheme cytochrome c family protein